MKRPSASYEMSYADGVEQEELAMERDSDVVLTSTEGRRERRRMRRADSGAGGLADEAPSAPQPEPAPGADGGGEADPTEPPPEDTNTQRYIVYTASMQLSVFNLADARARIESLPAVHGGYVQNLSNNTIVLRIPSAQLRPVMDSLGTLGVVEYRNLDAQDVTEEYLDIETRIAVLEKTQAQLLELLTKANTVKDALEVRKALDAITMELEVLKGRLRRLESLVSFSTLTVQLVERGPHTPTPNSNDPFPWVDSLGVESTEWK